MRFDLMQSMGPLPAEPEADVSGVLRSPEGGNGLGQQLRSLAHPGGDSRLKSRLMAKVKVNSVTDCWEWTASKQRGGYGQINVGGRRGKPQRAHRVSFGLFCGEIPAGLHVLHRCDNRGCVNPSHLFLGTNADNQSDMDAKGRRVNVPLKGEANGSCKLTSAEVVAIRAAVGTQRALAAQFGISRSQVHNIRSGRLWKCLEQDASCVENRYQKLNFGPELT